MIRHESPDLAVHLLPPRTESALEALYADFAPDPERKPIEGELDELTLSSVLPRAFLWLAEWRRP